MILGIATIVVLVLLAIASTLLAPEKQPSKA